MKLVAARTIDGQVAAPPSKSFTVRAVAAASLVQGWTRISNPSGCQDAEAAVRAAEALGTRIERRGGDLCCRGGGAARAGVLDCGESGLSLRVFAALAALQGRELRLEGRGSLRVRPMDMIAEPLRALGARCRSRRGRPPLVVRGPLRGGVARLEGAESSQALSGLLMACPLAAGPTALSVRGLRSRPYVRMTLELLARFGIRVEADERLARFRIPGGQAYLRDQECRIEGDWSGAAPLLVAGALGGRARVEGLRADSLQADRAVLEALRLSGARVEVAGGAVLVRRGRPRAFRFDASDCPDLLPPLVALACSCPGETVLAGAGRLRAKESDRAAALESEFGKMGAAVRVVGGRLVVRGGPLRCARVDPHGDHRIAMACAVGALGAGCGVEIDDPGCVAKSYPGFFQDLSALGAEVR